MKSIGEIAYFGDNGGDQGQGPGIRGQGSVMAAPIKVLRYISFQGEAGASPPIAFPSGAWERAIHELWLTQNSRIIRSIDFPTCTSDTLRAENK